MEEFNGPLKIGKFGNAVELNRRKSMKGRAYSTRADWHKVDWNKVEVKVREIQEKIVIASMNKDMKEVYKLQWTLLRSFEARALAVKKVVINKGGRTAGTDMDVWKGPQEYWSAILELEATIIDNKNYKASPVKRVWIPKPGSEEKRPLGIPTMKDRAMQAIYLLCLDPVLETNSDSFSFGFRKHRSTHDAITALRSILDKSYHPRWIVEADISKCFDKISHEFLLKHTPICHRHILEQWLKAGIMEELNFVDVSEGTPQGGIISPALCNVALNGIEKLIKESNPRVKGLSAGVHIIRYADDMIITAKTQELALKNKAILGSFLAERGLMLNEKKTLITHIKHGFDFLGFNLRRYDWKANLNQSTDQNTVLVIKPSKKGIKKIMNSVQEVIIDHKPLEAIISELNPILRGWAEHKRISYHSQGVFIKLDNYIYQKMMIWLSKRKGRIDEKLKHNLVQTASRKWNWGTSSTLKLINLAEIPIIKVSPLKLDKNPYLIENLDYYEKRKQSLILAKFRATIYRKFLQKCPICNLSLHNGENIELHHIIPVSQGGKFSLENILPLHEICHKQVTHGDKTLERFKVALPVNNVIKGKQLDDKDTKSKGNFAISKVEVQDESKKKSLLFLLVLISVASVSCIGYILTIEEDPQDFILSLDEDKNIIDDMDIVFPKPKKEVTEPLVTEWETTEDPNLEDIIDIEDIRKKNLEAFILNQIEASLLVDTDSISEINSSIAKALDRGDRITLISSTGNSVTTLETKLEEVLTNSEKSNREELITQLVVESKKVPGVVISVTPSDKPQPLPSWHLVSNEPIKSEQPEEWLNWRKNVQIQKMWGSKYPNLSKRYELIEIQDRIKDWAEKVENANKDLDNIIEAYVEKESYDIFKEDDIGLNRLFDEDNHDDKK